MSFFTNYYSSEATLNNSSTTITFPCPVGKIVVVNDSGLNNLVLKFSASGNTTTLYPTEVFEVDGFKTGQIILTTTAPVPYRVWAYY